MRTNVLVVDDDSHMRIALKESLSKVGYAVLMADNGLKAVEEIDRNMLAFLSYDVKIHI